VALCPAEIRRDDGDTWLPSKAQLWIRQCWADYWQHVYNRVSEHKARLYVVVNGECCEGVHHGTQQIVTANMKTQRAAAIELLEPVVKEANKFFVVRGTEAHSGRSASEDEAIAADLGAEKGEETGACSWWHLELTAEGVHHSFDHHATVYGWRPWTEKAAAARQSAIVQSECAERGEVPPHICTYSHGHYFADSGLGTRPRVIYTLGWQLQTAYAHRRGGGHRIRPIGGMIYVCQDGHCEPELWDRLPKRRMPWTEQD
jgi:hypothetical protein